MHNEESGTQQELGYFMLTSSFNDIIKAKIQVGYY